MLLGREDGSLDLYGLGKDTKCDFYAFHKSPITDLCWLSQNERAEEKIFATSSLEPHIYMYFFVYLDGTSECPDPPCSWTTGRR